MNLAAKISIDNKIIQVIVGNAGWAETRLGGIWKNVDEASEGWIYDPDTNRCYPPESQGEDQ